MRYTADMLWGLHKHVRLPLEKHNFSSLTSGLEAGLATSAAIIIGLIESGTDPDVILRIGILIISVQAFNSAMGRYSGIMTEEEIETERPKRHNAIESGLIQFLAHIASSLLLFFALLLTGDVTGAIMIAISALILLFSLGIWKGMVLEGSKLSYALELVANGAIIISFGLIVGLFV